MPASLRPFELNPGSNLTPTPQGLPQRRFSLSISCAMNPRYFPPESGWRRNSVALAFVASLFLAGATSVRAFVFAFGDVSGSLDTTLSVGVLDRIQNPSPDLYGLTNTFDGVPGKAYSVNNDDGDLNFSRGIDSVLYKVTDDLELKWGDWGAFVRGYAFYDPKNQDTTLPHTPLSYVAKKQVGGDIVVLDHYITGKFDFGATPVTVRLGRQVISWGESTFIPNGINVINPVDVRACVRLARSCARRCCRSTPWTSRLQ